MHDFRLLGASDVSFKARNASIRGHHKASTELKSEAAIWPLGPLEPLNQQEKKGVTMPAAVVDSIKKKNRCYYAMRVKRIMSEIQEIP